MPKITPHEALIYVMITMSAADRQISDRELDRITQIVRQLPVFMGYDVDKLAKTAEQCGELLSDEEGLDEMLETIANALPKKLYETAYALAVEVAAADLKVPDEEIRLLELLRDALRPRQTCNRCHRTGREGPSPNTLTLEHSVSISASFASGGAAKERVYIRNRGIFAGVLRSRNKEETMNALVRTLFATAAFSLAAAGATPLATAASTDQNREPKAGEQGPPATVGAMQNEVGNKATSAEDVKRQTEGKPTLAQEAQQGNKNGSHPGMTEHAPGTVGAAPGAHPTSETARK